MFRNLRIKASAVVVVGMALTATVSSAHALNIRVTFNPKQPLAAQAEATLSKGVRIRSAQPLIVRGTLMGVTPQVANVRCDGVAIARTRPDDGAGWRLPVKGCLRVTWTIGFSTLSDKGADASAQANLYHAKVMTWVLSEPASLLRRPGVDGGRVFIHGAALVRGGLTAGKGIADTVPVPDMSDPPEFFFVGRVPTTTLTGGGRQVTYLQFGEADYAKLAQMHTAAIDYLMRITRAQPQRIPLTIAWLPIDESAGGIGAAAGMTTLLVNAVAQRGVLAPEQAPATLALVLQQQLQALLPPGMPTWIAVSLTEYYARKALDRTGADAMARTALDRPYLALAAPKRTMLEVQSRLNVGDANDLHLLHTEGPGFWLALDRALGKASGGQRSLDDELADVLSSEFDGARLPAALVEQWRQRVGAEAFDTLHHKYIGDL